MKQIPLIKPSVPHYGRFILGLIRLWHSRRLTNNGWYTKSLGKKLTKYLDINDVSLCSSGTMALSLSYKALGLKGKVITTPYSFIATSSSLVWEGLEPVFVDIEEDGYGIDPKEVLKAISPDVSCILAVHPYGIPCRYDEINRIGERYKIPVIYDAAQAFGVTVNGESILKQGDISVCSLHATKVFHACEGGMIVTNSEMVNDRVEMMKNFGFTSELEIDLLGINGKLSELHALMGCTLIGSYVDAWSHRRRIHDFYHKRLQKLTHIKLQSYPANVTPNYSYFPVQCDERVLPGLR